MNINDVPHVNIRDHRDQLKSAVGKLPIAIKGVRESRYAAPYVLASFGFTRGRAFFVCRCGRRTEKLYFLGGAFKCRTCAGIGYRQRHGERRLIANAGKVRTRLGGHPDMLLPFPRKPEQMTAIRWAKAFVVDWKIKQECSDLILEDGNK